jgi:hypothetical protein
MPKNTNLTSSFWALSEEEQTKVRYFSESGDSSKLDVRDFYLERASCIRVVEGAVSTVERCRTLSPAFDLMNSDQKTQIEGELLLAYYQLSTQYELDRIERTSYALPETAKKIRLCAELLNQLRLSAVQPKMDRELLCEMSCSGKYTQYLGVKLLVPVLLDSMDTIASRNKSATDFISFINERRLYWVWGGSTVSAILSVLPDDLAGISSARNTLGWTGFVGGSLSWILYFIRGSLAWCGLIEHTFFLSQEEQALGLTVQQRLFVQFEIRKYPILNDTLWGLCNCACFFVLVGSGLLGNLGNGLTALLLLMDASLTMWRMREESLAHHANLSRLRKDLAEIQQKALWAKKMGQSLDVYDYASQELRLKLSQAELDWKYKKISTAIDLIYSVSLLTAFSLLCLSAVLMPYAPLVMMVACTIVCFSFNLIYNTSMMSLNVSKIRENRKVMDDSLLKELEHFKDLLESCSKRDENQGVDDLRLQLKLSYLKIKQWSVDSKHEEKMLGHQCRYLIVSTVRDMLIPSIFIVSFVFLPLGVGMPLLALSCVLAGALYWYSQKTMPQKDQPVTLFPEKEYKKFELNARTHTPQALLASLVGPKNAGESGIQSQYVYN